MDSITNYSLLNTTNFRFDIVDAPYLNFFVQNVQLPTIRIGERIASTPFVDIPYPGDHVDFEPLVVDFLVDEDLGGYREIFEWIKGLGFPKTFEEYRGLLASTENKSVNQVTMSDIKVMTMTGSRNVNYIFTFVDAFPISLSAPRLTTTSENIPVVTCQVEFQYTIFDVTTTKSN